MKISREKLVKVNELSNKIISNELWIGNMTDTALSKIKMVKARLEKVYCGYCKKDLNIYDTIFSKESYVRGVVCSEVCAILWECSYENKQIEKYKKEIIELQKELKELDVEVE